MRYVLFVLVVLPGVLLVVGSIAGKVQVRSCCAADPRRDRRMAAAFEDRRGETAGLDSIT